MRTLPAVIAAYALALLAAPALHAQSAPGPAGDEGQPARRQQWRVPSSDGATPSHALLFRPRGDGPFRLAVIAHASTENVLRRAQMPQPEYRALAAFLVARGFAVLVPDANVNVAAAVKYMAGIARPVTLAGTSRGTQRAAEGIAAGARPDALVLTSGFLSPQSGQGVNRHVIRLVGGSPGVLPRTLVVHHRHDECHFTLPSGVPPFLDWAKGKASVVWLDGGANNGDACQAGGHHGFAGLDGQVVNAIVNFAAK